MTAVTKRRPEGKLPTINAPLMRGFRIFNRRYLRKHFHTVAINRASLQSISLGQKDSLVVYANHASWWDPLTAIFLAEELFSGFGLYAPIDEVAFQKYRIFGQMGFFPVDQNSLRGAKEFLRISHEILATPASSIWLTPEGRFVDVRDASVPFMPGLAHLAHSLASETRHMATGSVWFIPAAIEYTFWEERLPELLVWMGQPVSATDNERIASMDLGSKQQWNEQLSAGLRAAQAELSIAAQNRATGEFDVCLRSSGKTHWMYDWARKTRSWLTGKKFRSDHGNLFSE